MNYRLFNLKADSSEQENLAATEAAQSRRLMQGFITESENQGAMCPVDSAGEADTFVE